jgi:hypothetical protein
MRLASLLSLALLAACATTPRVVVVRRELSRATLPIDWSAPTLDDATARQILADGSITATGPGEGTAKVPRYYCAVDYERGAATGATAPIPLNVGAGAYRTSLYCQWDGILTILFSTPYETDEKTGSAYITEEHASTLDELEAAALVLFTEEFFPFTAALLPNLDVQKLMPIEADDRPEELRECNVRRVRFQLRCQVR